MTSVPEYEAILERHQSISLVFGIDAIMSYDGIRQTFVEDIFASRQSVCLNVCIVQPCLDRKLLPHVESTMRRETSSAEVSAKMKISIR